MNNGIKKRFRWDSSRQLWRLTPTKVGHIGTKRWIRKCSDCRREVVMGIATRACPDCTRKRQRSLDKIRGRASAAVAKAVACGDLPRLYSIRGERNSVPPDYEHVRCVDCGNKARVYDHRDYSRPLDVEPVCFSCNRQRGPAANWAHNLIKLPRHFSKTIQ